MDQAFPLRMGTVQAPALTRFLSSPHSPCLFVCLKNFTLYRATAPRKGVRSLVCRPQYATIWICSSMETEQKQRSRCRVGKPPQMQSSVCVPQDTVREGIQSPFLGCVLSGKLEMGRLDFCLSHGLSGKDVWNLH